MSKPLDFAAHKSIGTAKPNPANYCTNEDIDISTSLDRESVMISIPTGGMVVIFQMTDTSALKFAAAIIEAVAGPGKIEPRRAGG